jgi:hypothetical protein
MVATTTTKHHAYFAQFNGTPGILTKVGDFIIFLDTETNAVTTITPANAMQVLTLDAVDHWVEQYYADIQAARLEQAVMAA